MIQNLTMNDPFENSIYALLQVFITIIITITFGT